MREFKESQYFNQWWIQVLNLAVLGLLGYFVYKWFFLNESIDKVSPTDRTGQLIVIVAMILSLGITYLFRLKTRIDENGLHYRFFPFHLSEKSISWYDVEKCYIRQYSPITEYGGWGIRIAPGKGGKAFNIKGNQGIQIELKTGKRVLFGTQKPEEAQKVISKYYKNERI